MRNDDEVRNAVADAVGDFGDPVSVFGEEESDRDLEDLFPVKEKKTKTVFGLPPIVMAKPF